MNDVFCMEVTGIGGGGGGGGVCVVGGGNIKLNTHVVTYQRSIKINYPMHTMNGHLWDKD